MRQRTRYGRIFRTVFLSSFMGTAPAGFAAISSTGNVEPDPIDGTTNGGVFIGDHQQGTLTIDNGSTLNSTFGVVAANAGASGSQVTLSGAGIWNLTGDLDIGEGALGTAQVGTGSAINAAGQTRLGTLAGGSGMLTLNGSTLTTSSLVVGVAGAGSLTAGGSAAQNASTLNTGFAVFGNDPATTTGASSLSSSVGTGTLTGPGTVWNNSQGFIIALNSHGSLAISAGASLSTGYLEVSRFGTDGTLTVDNSSVTIAQNAGYTATPSFIVGTEAGSVGHATISGANATLTIANGGYLEVGRHASSAQLDFNAGARASIANAIVGTEQDGSGTLNLSGSGTTLTATSDVEIARNGRGTLNLTSGATMSSLTGRVGENATAVGTAMLSDPGTRWTTSGGFEVGGAGSGSMALANGAAANVGTFITVGASAGATGTVDLSGGASVTSGEEILVGADGTGSVTVRGAAHLDNANAASPTGSSALIADFADGTGTVTVTGTGSLWTNSGVLNVGVGGTGAMHVESGGRVQSSVGVIARLPGSHGTVALTGAGSVWSIGQALYVGGRPASGASGTAGSAGPGGAAVLSVGTGASVAVANTVQLFGSNSTIDLSGGGAVGIGAGQNPEAGALHVFSGGKLWGGGTVNGNVLNDGTLAPTALSVHGNYTQSASGLLGLHVTAAGTNDTLSVTGAAGLGGTLELDFPNFTPSPGQTFRLLLSPAAAGSFNSVVTAGLVSGWQYSLTTDGQGLLLTSLGAARADVPGDANGDGTVNFTDLLTLAQHYGQPALLSQGDFTGDGAVAFDDLLILAQHYGPAPAAGQIAALSPDVRADVLRAFAEVPEPASLWAPLAAAGILLRSRPRRRRGDDGAKVTGGL